MEPGETSGAPGGSVASRLQRSFESRFSTQEAVVEEKEGTVCPLVIDIAVNSREVEAVVNSGPQVSVIGQGVYDSLSEQPLIVETVHREGVSTSGVIGWREEDVVVDLLEGCKGFKMPLYRCILDLDYLKTRGAVVDLGRGNLTAGVTF